MKKSASEKRKEYELSLGIVKEEVIQKKETPIETIEIFYELMNKKEMKVCNTLEELDEFLRCQNPMILERIKSYLKGKIKIKGLGHQLSFEIIK